MKEAKHHYISTDVKNLWKEVDSPKASRLGVLARAGTNVSCPCGSAQPIQICRTTFHCSKTGWILAHCLRWSKRKVCEARYQRSHAIHNFSTSAENVQVSKKCSQNKGIWI